jgi:glycosyltransferase involved in cell wall biosynthesis
MKPTLYFVNLPHTQTTKDYVACAYTQKLVKIVPALRSLGYRCVVMASEENEIECDEFLTLWTREDQLRWFGENDHHTNFFNITWGVDDPCWVESNLRAIDAIRERIQPNDLIMLIAGLCQKLIADSFPEHKSIEYGIGYQGVFSPFKVFESYAWMHHIYGRMQTQSGGYFDQVIPNYFDEEDFSFNDTPEDYLLFVGRLTNLKGPHVAAEIAKRTGRQLIMAGQGVAHSEPGLIVATDGTMIEGDHVTHVGHVDPFQRSELMRNAYGVITPTVYIEPFGGVSIEALMCGTPVIATDFGAFTETIPHGHVGYRFRTIGEAVWGVNNLDKLDRTAVNRYAVDNFSTEKVKYKYDEYLQQIATISTGDCRGFYTDWPGENPAERYAPFR